MAKKKKNEAVRHLQSIQRKQKKAELIEECKRLKFKITHVSRSEHASSWTCKFKAYSNSDLVANLSLTVLMLDVPDFDNTYSFELLSVNPCWVYHKTFSFRVHTL